MSAPPRVLYIAPSAELYGSDLALERMAVAHLQLGGRSVVAVPEEGPLANNLRAAGVGVRVVRLAVLRRRLMNPRGVASLAVDVVRSAPSLVRTGHRERVQLMHSNTAAVVSGVLPARWLRVPHVWSLREDLLTHGGAVPALFLRLGADHVIAMSNAIRDALLQRQPSMAGRVSVIRDGVDPDRFARLPPVAEARRRLGLDPDRPVVAMLARIKAWKGQWLLVEAMRRLTEQGHDDVQAVLAGDIFPGDELELSGLRNRIAAAGLDGRVLLPGFCPDPGVVLAAADVVAAPSTTPEPYGLTVVDALTAGVPVVASAHGGHLETVRHTVDGFLVAPGDAYALAAAIRRLLESDELRRDMARAAWRDRGRFAAALAHEKIWRIYDEVLSRKHLSGSRGGR